jgi:hypothetical protein
VTDGDRDLRNLVFRNPTHAAVRAYEDRKLLGLPCLIVRIEGIALEKHSQSLLDGRAPSWQVLPEIETLREQFSRFRFPFL